LVNCQPWNVTLGIILATNLVHLQALYSIHRCGTFISGHSTAFQIDGK
jgi:hypothetical protein